MVGSDHGFNAYDDWYSSTPNDLNEDTPLGLFRLKILLVCRSFQETQLV